MVNIKNQQIEIILNSDFASEEEIKKLNCDNKQVEIEGKKLTPSQPQESIFNDICLFIVNNIVPGLFTDLSIDSIKKCYKVVKKHFNEKGVYLWNSRSKKRVSWYIELNAKNDVKIRLLSKKELTEVQIANIINVCSYLEEGEYVIIIETSGEMNTFTMLEYAHWMHDKQICK